METTVIILVIAGIAIFALIIIFFNNKAVIKRKLKKAERKRLSEFIDGESARVVGTIECFGTPLTAPLSGRKCAHYYILVEQERSSGKSSSWHTLIEEEVSGDFVIRDGANRASIQGPTVKSYIVQDRKYKSGLFNDASQNLERYLKQKGHESENMLGFNKTLRYKEGILEQGEKVAVYGKGVWKSAESLNLPEAFGRVLEIQSTSEEAVYLSDDPDTTQETIKKVQKVNKVKDSSGFGEADSRYFQKSSDDRYFRKK
ncbi:hypothetical protein J1N10_13625 [Carboxylicivirga sp. A043]|uniref:hypothetical protein n=1 Tax=Carboxylicivirga litoralis TaxID=2816963 RepID=UPI0021CB1AE2|nr:hypothetical protein [Carboxylicivirga sp. A043]MCU4157024.1 hypothetical protein [Carboxylicivirga sp. A043]